MSGLPHGVDTDGGDAFLAAVRPLVDAIGGVLLPVTEADGDDVVLEWGGRRIAAVRLPHLSDSLEHLLNDLRRRYGRPLDELDRRTKQAVVRTLEARGAFTVRHGVETVATALGVSRFTVYNYLNRESAGGVAGAGERPDPAAGPPGGRGGPIPGRSE
ncbi:helix-turn-helix domain-containing protein [Streptomyces sp. ST2-7A]|uniref:helix-turn-helix domain-containing protein n=1 Tax=Streptomyces sp. ST2-7A TaxID=2907214 RepID=UPI001F1F2C25|nr:helix-turn-helix domain-containing protein [Streptomyces sp. ST2-7A]MCE7082057.1 helix-turn-helix domain-containing protein [Streptomyces sp. ST2-7A]